MPETKKTYVSRINQRGATVIEFAVVVLLLVTILFGILELSFIFLQRHFVANAAREGVRIGIRANNFNCFDNSDTSWYCQSNHANARTYRKTTIVQQLTNCAQNGYLCSLYENSMAGVVVDVPPPTIIDPTPPTIPERRKILTVTVTVPNFFPQLVSRIVPAYIHKKTFSYTATGDYENAAEP